jgi:hypothetical protein
MKALIVGAAVAAALSGAAAADTDGAFDREGHIRHGHFFIPGNLVVSRSVYDNRASNVVVGSILPPNCAATTGGCGGGRGGGGGGEPPPTPYGTTTFTTPASALPRGFFSTR